MCVCISISPCKILTTINLGDNVWWIFNILVFLLFWKTESFIHTKLGKIKTKTKFLEVFCIMYKIQMLIMYQAPLKWIYIIWIRSSPQICKVEITTFILQRKKMKHRKAIWFQEKERKDKTLKTNFSLFYPQNLKTCKFKINLNVAKAQCIVVVFCWLAELLEDEVLFA